MHLKKWMVAAIALVQVHMAAAQEDSALRRQPATWVYGAVVQAGILEGQRGTSLQLQVINGFQYKSWFGGIGAGLDYYFVRSIPVVAHIKKNIWSERVPLFVYGDAGMHFPWLKKDVENQWYASDLKSGFIYELGLGYKAKLNSRNALVFSAGYSQKQMVELRKDPYIWGPPNMPVHTNRFDYTLNRISLKAGFQF
jgi:hypothetical protein